MGEPGPRQKRGPKWFFFFCYLFIISIIIIIISDEGGPNPRSLPGATRSLSTVLQTAQAKKHTLQVNSLEPTSPFAIDSIPQHSCLLSDTMAESH